MFPEISASFTAIKESLSLLKVINDAKNDAELKAATFELQRKLHEIQMDNLRLIDLLTASKQRIAELEQEIQNDIDFKTSAEAYTMYTLESGTFTYINKKAIDGSESARYLCANCYEERIISILQPKGIFGAYFQSFCPFCKNEYIMNKRSKKEPDTVIKIAANHYD